MFRVGEQRQFLKEVGKQLKLTSDELGGLVNISGRSFRGWINEKVLGNKEALIKLSELSRVKLPMIIEEREEWWSGRINGRMGGLVHSKKYGSPGTFEGRKKGGIMSQKRRRENPEYYRSLRCVVPRKFVFPNKSGGLAEFIGVLLGDGCITKGQVSVTLNKETDKLFIEYVVNLIQELFHYTPSVLERNHSKVKVIVISGIRMVEFLYGIGMRIGNKVRQQVDVPVWIKEDKEFVRWCVRGLVDTDGGVFEHKYKIRNKEYSYNTICL